MAVDDLEHVVHGDEVTSESLRPDGREQPLGPGQFDPAVSLRSEPVRRSVRLTALWGSASVAVVERLSDLAVRQPNSHDDADSAAMIMLSHRLIQLAGVRGM